MSETHFFLSLFWTRDKANVRPTKGILGIGGDNFLTYKQEMRRLKDGYLILNVQMCFTFHLYFIFLEKNHAFI